MFRATCCLILSAVGLAGCTAPSSTGGSSDNADMKVYGNPDAVAKAEIRDFGQAPETFRVKMETSKGPLVIEVTRAWAPHGADRFYNLVKNAFYDECRFFRVIEGFMAQTGINGDPEVQALWDGKSIPDDPVVESNRRGYVTYAKKDQPNSRTTQFFINFSDNTNLDKLSFAPFGRVIEGMEVVDSLYAGYGDGPPHGSGPAQREIQDKGNGYLVSQFPKLDHIKTAVVLEESESAAADGPQSGPTPKD